MKRITLVILVLIFVGLLCGCSKKDVHEDMGGTSSVFESDLQKLDDNITESTTLQNGESTVFRNSNEVLCGKVILIDAGHGKADYTKKEPIAPGSLEMKSAFVAGTSGENQTEAELNLNVAKKLEAMLKDMGAAVYMTRTGETTDMSNIDRAKMGNSLNADMTVRIHANGSEDTSVSGILTMVPGNKYVNEDVVNKSLKAGKIIQKHMIKRTGAKDGGLQERNDLTGFNWSEVPVVLVEMGFMTNPAEDKLLEDAAYQDKIVQGIADGVVEYFEQ